MKKIILLITILLLTACMKKEDGGVEINLLGELPEKGEVRLEVYGYDKMLADHKATLIVIHRESLVPGRTVSLEIPEDAEELIDPPVSSPENASYYVRAEIRDGEDVYTQDFDQNPFIDITGLKKADIQMKKR